MVVGKAFLVKSRKIPLITSSFIMLRKRSYGSFMKKNEKKHGKLLQNAFFENLIGKRSKVV